MTGDKRQPNVNDQPEQAKPEQAGQQAEQNQASAAPQPGQCTAPGRRPLFRSTERVGEAKPIRRTRLISRAGI